MENYLSTKDYSPLIITLQNGAYNNVLKCISNRIPAKINFIAL
ncbi:MAG: hypothetical protein ACI86M_001145 [Saprospiraceae bacterium]|jgi:hypothetical protein